MCFGLGPYRLIVRFLTRFPNFSVFFFYLTICIDNGRASAYRDGFIAEIGSLGLPCFVESPARLDARLVRKETLPIDNLSEP